MESSGGISELAVLRGEAVPIEAVMGDGECIESLLCLGRTVPESRLGMLFSIFTRAIVSTMCNTFSTKMCVHATQVP